MKCWITSIICCKHMQTHANKEIMCYIDNVAESLMGKMKQQLTPSGAGEKKGVSDYAIYKVVMSRNKVDIHYWTHRSLLEQAQIEEINNSIRSEQKD